MTDELMVLVSDEDRERLLNQRIDDAWRLINEAIVGSRRLSLEHAKTAAMVRSMEGADQE